MFQHPGMDLMLSAGSISGDKALALILQALQD
jgi:hypothetical protein